MFNDFNALQIQVRLPSVHTLSKSKIILRFVVENHEQRLHAQVENTQTIIIINSKCDWKRWGKDADWIFFGSLPFDGFGL